MEEHLEELMTDKFKKKILAKKCMCAELKTSLILYCKMYLLL